MHAHSEFLTLTCLGAAGPGSPGREVELNAEPVTVGRM